MAEPTFEWDSDKDFANQVKHGVPFREARLAFADPHHVIIEDEDHSHSEQRYFCLGQVGKGILTVRFTYRGSAIRIFGAGYWRKGRIRYEAERRGPLHRRTDRTG